MPEGIRKRPRKKGVVYEASFWSVAEKRKVRRTFDTLAEAKAWRRDAARDSRNLGPNPSDRRTVAGAGREFVAGMKSGAVRDRNGKPYKPSTVRSYGRALELGVIPYLGGRKLAEVTVQDVRGLIRKLRADGLSDSTVRNRLDPLRAIFRHEIEENRLDFNPTAGLRLPSGRRTRTPSASFEDVAALVEAIRPADRALWATAFYAGLRRGELRALRVSDVDFEANVIRVRRGWDEKEGAIDPKSEAGERDVPLADVLRNYLLDHLAHVQRGERDGTDLIFGRTADKSFVPSSVGNRAKTDWKRAGLAPVTLHDGRHLFASFLIHSSPEIDALALCEVMGHSSVQMTFDLYGHLLPGRRSEIREALNRHLVPAPE